MIQLILLDDVPKLGHMGDLVKVRPGYARNYLIPTKKAVVATENNQRQLQHRQRLAMKKRSLMKGVAQEAASKLNGLIVTISRKVGESDKLFGSVTTQDIERAVQALGFEIDRRKILIEQPLRSLGVYGVHVKLHADVNALLQVWVVADA